MHTNAVSLRDVAIDAYNTRPVYIKPREVAEAIGFSVEWLRLFSQGKVEDPGVVTVEKLIAYIKSRKGV